jgi:hypothetical protein
MQRLFFLLLVAALLVAVPSIVTAAPPMVSHPLGPMADSGPGITLALPGVMGQIEVKSFSLTASSGTLVIRKAGGPTPACATGKHYATAVLHDGAMGTYNLTNLTFGGNHPLPMVAGKPSEEISFAFTFTKIELAK